MAKLLKASHHRPAETLHSLDDVLSTVKSAIVHTCFKQQPTFSQSMLTDAVNLHFASAGRMIRARLCIDAGLKLHLPHADIVALAQVVEYLHNASLIHDDVQDQDTTRRGQQSLWVSLGVNAAICTGDFLISAAYRALSFYTHPQQLPRLMAAVHEQTGQAIHGQMDDLNCHGQAQPSLADYVATVKLKSGALLYLPMQLAFLAANHQAYLPQVKAACMAFAVGYQMFDDLEDLTEDLTKSDAAPALNIVSVLQASATQATATLEAAETQARVLCLQYLQQALQIAQVLPFATGDLLAKLSMDLQNKLHRKYA